MFGRRRRRGKHAGHAGHAGRAGHAGAGRVAGDAVGTATDAAFGAATDAAVGTLTNITDRTGPWDETEADAAPAVPRVDLGALRVPVAAELEVQLNLLHEEVVAVTVSHADSTLQLQAFAAPKSGGLWDEARQDIFSELRGGGEEPAEADGPFGRELRAQLPIQTEHGPVRQPARFVGVDGPRWLLRGVFTGPAGADPARGRQLENVLRGTVVVRGDAPMPPREPLPLQMPPNAADYGGYDDSVNAGPVPSYAETET